MNFEKISYAIKTEIIDLFGKNKLLATILNGIRVKRRKSIINADMSNMSGEILALIKGLDIQVYPMFGTLLSIYRDKEFLYADDYDFALYANECLDKEFINRLLCEGAELIGYSIVNDSKLVELSFLYKSVRIDFFSFDQDETCIIHECPNFRKERPSIEFGAIKIRKYTSYFKVRYPKYDLKYDNDWGLYIPDNCEIIFEKHYGVDWKVPKKSNFIDYESYEFKDGNSYTVQGEHVTLVSMLEENGFLK